MTALRSIDLAPFRGRYTGPQSDPGKRPELRWIKVSQLRIDPRYQREIGRRGTENILAIAHQFRWSMFSVVVVAPIGKGLFAIVDGQHHTTSAALREFDEVPCAIIDADELEQADAFVAINANVTAMSPLQIHAARLTAGNKDAGALAKACREAGVSICRYPVPANKMQPGETLAVGMLKAMFDKFGADVLVSALSCITQTRKGNPGMIRAQIVEALCTVLEAEPEWRGDRKKLIFAMQSFDFSARFNAARAKSIDSGTKVSTLLVEMIGDHLQGRFDAIRKDESVEEPPERAKAKAATPGATVAPAPVTGPGTISVGRQEVTFKGRHQRVTPRAAQLVGLLAKAKPNPIGDEFLIAKLWNVRPANAGEYLDGLVHELGSLKKIGLEVRSLRGVGRQIVEIES